MSFTPSLDTLGTNIRIGSRFNNIVDIRACDNDDVNKEYATDKGRVQNIFQKFGTYLVNQKAVICI